MSRKKPNRFVEFLNGKGFYIILILCVAAVGISGYVFFFSDSNDEDELLAVPSSAIAAPSVTPPSSAPSSSPAPSRTSEPLTTELPAGALHSGDVVMSTASPSDDTPVSTPEGAQSVAGSADLSNESESRPTAAFYVWPLGGEVINPFSVDELVFSNTLEDWRVHTGADIAGSLGALVSAVGDGIVEDVYFDEMMGETVVIDHGGETYSVYKNLSETVKVAPGDAVEAGQVIGAVGATADAESADSPHLHLEIIQAGAQIDPLDLLP